MKKPKSSDGDRTFTLYMFDAQLGCHEGDRPAKAGSLFWQFFIWR